MKNSVFKRFLLLLYSFVLIFSSAVPVRASGGNFIDVSKDWKPNPVAEWIKDKTGYDMYEPVTFGGNGPLSTSGTAGYLPPMLYKPVNYYAPSDGGIKRGVGDQTPDYNNKIRDMTRPQKPSSTDKITSSGATYETIYNSITTNSHNRTANYYDYSTSSNSYVKNDYVTTFNRILNVADNRTYVYNPIENNYYQFDYQDITYNDYYHTYNIQTDNYDYYITNNYNYVSYYIEDKDSGISDYVEIYYELPDGRDSFNLKLEDIWGQYFVYDVVNYRFVPEDDGKTIGLYHFDGNYKDSSYFNNPDFVTDSPIDFRDSTFGSGFYGSYMNFDIPNFDSNNFTVEMVLEVTDGHCFAFRYSGNYYFFGYARPGRHYLVIQCDNGEFSIYRNGKLYSHTKKPIDDDKWIRDYSTTAHHHQEGFIAFKDGQISFKGLDHIYLLDPEWDVSPWTSNNTVSFLIDELRVSNTALYSGDSVVVPSQPFDTNKVLVPPLEPNDNMIGVKGEYPVDDGEFRIGGVRPAYPTTGYVYVGLNDESVVETVQQFQGDGWYEVPAAIYQGGKWVDILGHNLSDIKYDEPVLDTIPESGGGSDTDSGSDNDSGGSGSGGGTVSGNDDGGGFGSGLNSLLDGISGFFGMLLEALGKVVTLITDFLSSFLSMFDVFTGFTDGFSSFLGSALGFLPSEIVSAIVVGVNICIVLAIFKFMRK